MSKGNIRRCRRLACFLAALILSAAAPHGPSLACGWWGDGENEDDDTVFVDADGNAVSDEGVSAPDGGLVSKVPGKAGYGLAVLARDRALPYLDATGGRDINRIGQLRGAGFAAVIDLGTQPPVTKLHRAETEALGMRYFSIPVSTFPPPPDQVTRFNRVIEDAANLPLVVYSETAELLEDMWVLSRK